MQGKNLLLISQVFYPDEVAVANLFTKLCVVLKEQHGAEIDVWCAQPSYSCLQRQPRHRQYKGIEIQYLPSANFHKDKRFGRVINVLSFSVSALLKLLFSGGKQIVITHTVPPFLAILIAMVCKMKKNRMVYVIMDVFPDGLVRLKRWSGRNLFVVAWKKLHNITFRIASRIIVIGRDMQEWIISVNPDAKEKVVYIPLWQDDDLIKPIRFHENPFVINHDLQDRFVVQYSGNMGLWNDMVTMGKAVNRVAGNVTFVFIGGGIRRYELIREIEPGNYRNALMVPFLPNHEYAFSVSACHIALVSLMDGLEGMAVPSKIIGIMASGTPVIAMVPEKSEIARIIKEENCGLLVTPGDVDGLLSAVIKLKDNEDLRKIMGKNGREAFENKYTTRIVAESYNRLFEELMINRIYGKMDSGY